MLTLLLVLVTLLYAKWIFAALFYPMMCLRGVYENHKCLATKALAVPHWCVERLLRNGGGRFVLFNIGIIPSLHIRKWLYMGLGAKIGKRAVFHFKTELRHPHGLIVGEGTIIGDNALLDARNGLTFGRNVNLSSNVSIYTQQHDHRSPTFNCPNPEQRKMSVEIDDRAWLGSNVIVLPGVHIGEGAVCCAGCVVTKDVAPFDVVAGIPAKPVGKRPEPMKYEFSGESCRLY